MQVSRRVFIEEFLDFVGAAGDPKAELRAQRLLVRLVETIWLKRAWRQFVMPDPYVFSTAANVGTYALPSYFGRISSHNRTIRNITNGRDLEPVDIDELRMRYPAQGTSLEVPGCPTAYAIAGTMPVQVQPASTGDALEVLSDSAADTTIEVYLEGLDATGLEVMKQVTLTGVNPVAVGTWAKITVLGKSYPDGVAPTTAFTSSVGTVTLRKVADQTVLQTLASDQDAREHLSLVLARVPDQVYRISVPILRTPRPLIKDADALPANWRNVLFDKMVMDWNVGNQDAPPSSSDTWPSLVDLVCWDNAQTAAALRSRRPWGG